MTKAASLSIDNLIDEVERAYAAGLVIMFSVSENSLRLDLSPHLPYQKTYDLFGYLQDKYYQNEPVITNAIILNSHSLMVYF